MALVFLLLISIPVKVFSITQTTAEIEITEPEFGSVAVHPQDIKATFDINRPGFLWPIKDAAPKAPYGDGQKFGYRIPPTPGASPYHCGIDISDKNINGKSVVAVFGGKVITVVERSRAGWYVVISHDNKFWTRYLHLEKFTDEQRDKLKGKTVKAGDVIGYVGETGIGTGVHLHFGVREGSLDKWYAVNPGDYLDPVNAKKYVSPLGAIDRVKVETYLDGDILAPLYSASIPQGYVRDVPHQCVWDLIKTVAKAGEHNIRVEVFDGVIPGISEGQGIGAKSVTAIVEPPKVIDYGPQDDIGETKPTIFAKVVSPSEIPISKAALYLDGVKKKEITPDSGSTMADISYIPEIDLGDGTHKIKIVAEDICGNKGEKEWEVRVSLEPKIVITSGWGKIAIYKDVSIVENQIPYYKGISGRHKMEEWHVRGYVIPSEGVKIWGYQQKYYQYPGVSSYFPEKFEISIDEKGNFEATIAAGTRIMGYCKSNNKYFQNNDIVDWVRINYHLIECYSRHEQTYVGISPSPPVVYPPHMVEKYGVGGGGVEITNVSPNNDRYYRSRYSHHTSLYWYDKVRSINLTLDFVYSGIVKSVSIGATLPSE